jgi:hypothetical protein
VDGISISTIGSADQGRGGIEERAVHIGQARGHDDAGGEMIAGLGPAGEARQLGQSDVHAECGALGLPAGHSGGDRRVHGARREQLPEEQLRVHARGDGFGAVGLPPDTAPAALPRSTMISSTGASRMISTPFSRTLLPLPG